MRTINIHEAKTHLSRLIDDAVRGETFIIAKAGRPLVKVVRLDADVPPQRVGFMDGQISVPDEFDRLNCDEIANLFGAVD